MARAPRTAPGNALLDRPLAELLADLADPEPSPGAGSAAAVTTAMAAALLAMAARASRESWPEARSVAAQAEALRDRAAGLAELNASAYADALEALTKPQPGGEALERRDFRLGTALSHAAAIPLRVAEAACDVAELGLLVVERGDPVRRADAAAAVLLADSAARVGAHLVSVNLTAHPGDDRVGQAAALVDATARAAERALAER